MPVCRRNIAKYRAVYFQEGGKMKRHQCHDHSSPLMCLMASISSLGFCYSDLALDASLGVICDIIPIAISSKPATQFIPKFKCTHYQVRWKTIKTHLLPYRPPPPFSTRETSPQMCRQQSQKHSPEELSKTTPRGVRASFSNKKPSERALVLNAGVMRDLDHSTHILF